MGTELIGNLAGLGIAELLGAIAWTSAAATAWNLTKAALGLGFVIFVHELGHFLVAKACGVKCEKFYIGFDIPLPFGLPSKIYHVQWGETEYGIGVLPLGGYVKMLGQDDNPMNAEEEARRTQLPSTSATDAETAVRPGVPQIDPRSYTAKSVPQRMAIISAGVIVNLIFAVIFAATAYWIGVPITPCEIGQVISGGPAWKAGLEPGSRILQIGEHGKRSETLRFDWDLRQGVGLHGDDSDLPLTVRTRSGEEKTVLVRPVTVTRGWEKLSTIGISAAQTLELRAFENEPPALPESAAARAQPPLQDRDKIVAVDGWLMKDHSDLVKYLAQHVDRDLKVQVERGKNPEIVNLVVPCQKWRTIGATMDHGPITAVRPGSPADRAGIREGDRLLAVDGQPLGDPLLLPDRIRPWHGRELKLSLQRPGQSQPVEVVVTPAAPEAFDWHWSVMPRAPMAVEALGFAFTVTPAVLAVETDSPAAQSGLQPGDRITAIQVAFKGLDRELTKAERAKLLNEGKETPLDDDLWTWTRVAQMLQHLPSDQELTLVYQRGNAVGKAKVSPVESNVFLPDRGFAFASRSETHVASGFGEAISLGLRQTWEDATRVVRLLQKLVSGSVSVTNLGGIGSIAYVASSEASEGETRLLIFLTMLSANLAVLNFLPIPALDGGHMVFLTYEGLFRKPVSERVQVALTIAGVACLLGLMLFVNALDVHRFFLR